MEAEMNFVCTATNINILYVAYYSQCGNERSSWIYFRHRMASNDCKYWLFLFGHGCLFVHETHLFILHNKVLFQVGDT